MSKVEDRKGIRELTVDEIANVGGGADKPDFSNVQSGVSSTEKLGCTGSSSVVMPYFSLLRCS
ncbi:hypothetical protein [Lysobacter terrae]